jgi:hypothetical protein
VRDPSERANLQEVRDIAIDSNRPASHKHDGCVPVLEFQFGPFASRKLHFPQNDVSAAEAVPRVAHKVCDCSAFGLLKRA